MKTSLQTWAKKQYTDIVEMSTVPHPFLKHWLMNLKRQHTPWGSHTPRWGHPCAWEDQERQAHSSPPLIYTEAWDHLAPHHTLSLQHGSVPPASNRMSSHIILSFFKEKHLHKKMFTTHMHVHTHTHTHSLSLSHTIPYKPCDLKTVSWRDTLLTATGNVNYEKK